MTEAAERTGVWRAVRDEEKSEAVKRIERSLDLIDDNLAINSVFTVLRRYGIRLKSFRAPKCSVTKEAYTPRGSKFLICGSASRDEFKIHEPGVHQREERGANYLLTLLHVYFHEYTHMLEGEYQTKQKELSVGGMRFMGSKRVSGYMTRVVFNLPKEFEFREGTLVTNSMLNEAVTESFARECVAEYLRLDPDFGGVGEVAISIHRELMESDSDLVFYPEPVQFLTMLSQELKQALGSERDVKRLLYGGYFKGTDVLRSRKWKRILKQCDLYGIMQACAGELPAHAYKLIAQLHSEMRKIETVHLKVVR